MSGRDAPLVLSVRMASLPAVSCKVSVLSRMAQLGSKKAGDLLAPCGKIPVIGLARSKSFTDFVIEGFHVLPVRIGSLLHGEQQAGDIGTPTQQPA